MATVLEELLIKVGFDVDQKGLEKTRDSIRDDLQATGKETNANKKRNKSLKDQKNKLEDINDEKEKGEKENKKKDQEEEKRIGRGKQANKILNDAKGLLGGVSKGWVAAGVAAAAYTVKMAGANDGVAKFSRTINADTDKIQQWEYAAGRTGSSAEALRGTLASLTATIGAVESGAAVPPDAFRRLGINVWETTGQVKDAIDVLDELGRKTKKHTPSARYSLLTGAGVDPSLINLLTEERLERDNLLAKGKLGVESKEQLISSEEFFDESLTLWRGIKEDTAGVRQISTDMLTGIMSLVNAGRSHRGAPISTGPRRSLESALMIDKLPWNVEQNVNIEVSGAQNPNDIAIQIKEVLSSEVMRAGNNANKSGSQ